MHVEKSNFRIIKTFISLMIVGLFVLTAAHVNAEIIVYSEGFEVSDGGYTHTGTLDQWEWGQPSAGFTPGPGAANSGLNCWGTDLDDHVPSNSDSYLTSPAIAVPALGANEVARVRFFAWIAVDLMLDRGEFQVSSDGSTWETMAELLGVMQGNWTEYYFDVSNYAGGDLYLRFRCRADGSNAFWSPYPYNMAGLYVDDIAVVIADAPSVQTTVTMEAWEDQYTYASCPWVYTWNGTEYVKDNDVYSTARGEAMEYTDYYLLNEPPVSTDGKYLLQLRETDDEESYTDRVALMTVDHDAGVSIAPDDSGNILTYSAPAAPLTAVDDQGSDVSVALAAVDGTGVNGYNGDTVLLDFSNVDTTNGATLVLCVKGFIDDGQNPVPTLVRPPAVYIQTQDSNGQWVTQNKFWPRWEPAVMAYDLQGALSAGNLVRLFVTSCHENKYHLIDYVGLDGSAQQNVTVNVLSPASAVQSINGDVTAAITSSDDVYAYMARGESISMEFAAPEDTGQERDFIIVSEGYYVPIGTYFIYTWDGTDWVQRDAWTIEGAGDQTRTFDLSLWLPDPDGDWKIRIWQDYWWNGAGIDYVGIMRGVEAGIMDNAYDLKKSMDVTSLLIASDDNRDNWSADTSARDRWVEVLWEPFEINTPPTTNPVMIINPASSTPTISWTYNDVESDPQVMYEVEVWTGPGGTGTNVWDPASGAGAMTSVVYAGTPLIPGGTYYARVKAYDGFAWGGWSEASWTVPETIAVDLDIKPTSCPNPFNVKAQGVLPVAILGTETFDVTQIDIASLRLETVAPIRSSLEDVATPLENGVPVIPVPTGPINVITVDITPFVSPGDYSFGPGNTMGMALQAVDQGSDFNVTEVTPDAFRALTAEQLAAYDLIAINNHPDRIAGGLGTVWHNVVGVETGGRVVLNSHDAPRFKMTVCAGCGFSGCNPGPGVEPFGTHDLIRQSALWAGGVPGETGLLIFNDAARFPTVGGIGWENPELELPAAWGITDADQSGGNFAPGGGYTDILPAFETHPIYIGLSDVRFGINTISSFAANIVDTSFHSVFASFNPAILTPTEVIINSGIIDPGGYGCGMDGGFSVLSPDGTAITLIRDAVAEYDCECTTEGPDGYVDLTLKFKRQELVDVIGDVEHDDELSLTIEGTTLDGVPIYGQDCIVIRGRHRGLGNADTNQDGIVNILDLMAVSEKWLQKEILTSK